MTAAVADPGSFRDPAGQVYRLGSRVLRKVGAKAATHYEAARDRGILRKYSDRGLLVDSKEVDAGLIGVSDNSRHYVLEHPVIPFISYPYEWSFALLKEAALFHLRLQHDLLLDGFTLSDASAYNVQFLGNRPIYIDVTSIRRYEEGSYWLAHNQFCEQFLNPLLLRAYCGVPHNDWFRGRLEGISSIELSRLLPARKKLSFRVLSHVVGPSRLQARRERKHASVAVRKPLPQAAYAGLINHLLRWIESLEPEVAGSYWQNYEAFHSYSDREEASKRDFVDRFVSETLPDTVWDLGCNTGAYSKIALGAGAKKVVGFDSDHGALDRAYRRSCSERLDFLPLYFDGANPSPDQGWSQTERMGLSRRRNADALLALAFIHHISIPRNVPLDSAVQWLVGLAPRGVIEFVQKDDPTVREMLALREDVFDYYDEPSFLKALNARARIVSTRKNSENGRLLVAYQTDSTLGCHR